MYPQPREAKQQGFWASLGLLPKILIAVAVLIIATTLLFGFNLGNLGQFFVDFLKVVIELNN